MALKITGDTVRISSALSSPSSCTVGFWFRRPSQDLSLGPRFARFGSSTSKILEYVSTPTIQIVGISPTTFSVGVGDWCYLAFTKSGGTLALYGFTDATAKTVTTIVSPQYAPTTADIVEFGDCSGVYGSGYVDGEFLDCRAWDSVLTTDQLNTEKNSSSPVISSGLLLSASLESALTASVGTNFTATVGTSYEFTANTPTARTSGASVTVTSLSDDSLSSGQTGITITGTGFPTSAGTRKVIISPTNSKTDGNAVEQTVTAWTSSTSITFTAVRGALNTGTDLYLFVVDNDGNANASGAVLQFVTAKKLKLLLSSAAASTSSVAGVVFAAPTGGAITGAKLGEFTGATFETALESSQAVLKVPVGDFGGSALTTSDTPVVFVRAANGKCSGIRPATVVEE